MGGKYARDEEIQRKNKISDLSLISVLQGDEKDNGKIPRDDDWEVFWIVESHKVPDAQILVSSKQVLKRIPRRLALFRYSPPPFS